VGSTLNLLVKITEKISLLTTRVTYRNFKQYHAITLVIAKKMTARSAHPHKYNTHTFSESIDFYSSDMKFLLKHDHYYHRLAAYSDIRECVFSQIVGFGRHQVLVNHRATTLRDLIARQHSRKEAP